MAIKTLDGTAVIAGLVGFAGMAGAIETGSGMQESFWLIVAAVLVYRVARFIEKKKKYGGVIHEAQEREEADEKSEDFDGEEWLRLERMAGSGCRQPCRDNRT